MFICKLYPRSQQGAYYTPPVYAAQPHVIHHTTVVQPNSIPSTALYPAPVPVPTPRNNGMAAMGMVAGTTMAMSAGGSLIFFLTCANKAVKCGLWQAVVLA